MFSLVTECATIRPDRTEWNDAGREGDREEQIKERDRKRTGSAGSGIRAGIIIHSCARLRERERLRFLGNNKFRSPLRPP